MSLAGVERNEYGCVPNILIVGSEPAAETVLQTLTSLFPGPTEIRVLPGPLRRLPRADCAALILKNVGALTEEQQEELWQWLDSSPRVTVVSVSSSSLFSQVENGTFSERLYYRLNTILEDEDTAFGTASWLVKSLSWWLQRHSGAARRLHGWMEMVIPASAPAASLTPSFGEGRVAAIVIGERSFNVGRKGDR
jgi:hypothetical protein